MFSSVDFDTFLGEEFVSRVGAGDEWDEQISSSASSRTLSKREREVADRPAQKVLRSERFRAVVRERLVDLGADPETITQQIAEVLS